jgi:predicted nucleotidyltransferase
MSGVYCRSGNVLFLELKKAALQRTGEHVMPPVMSGEEIVAYIRSQMERLRIHYHVRKIALIGSFARDEQTPESDIDILIDLEDGTPNIYEIKRELRDAFELKFGRRVEIASERYLKPYYRDQILQEAVYV